MSKSTHSLADLYDLSITRLFLTGPQAILRMVLMQSERDRQAGLEHGRLCLGLSRLAGGHGRQPVRRRQGPSWSRATSSSCRASTRILRPPPSGARSRPRCAARASIDGVFAVWYGKGPGVDRSGDVFRHANMAGTSPHGGVLAIAGDDHSGESSTVVHASDVALSDAHDPGAEPRGRAGDHRLRPASALPCRAMPASGLGSNACMTRWNRPPWSKLVRNAAPPSPPKDFTLPPDGLSIRPSDDRVRQEERLHMPTRSRR